MSDDGSILTFLANQNRMPTPPLNKVRIITKRGKRSEQFANISKENVAVVDKLIDLAETLANANRGTEAAQIVKIVKDLLNNNQKLQQVVSEALLDIPN